MPNPKPNKVTSPSSDEVEFTSKPSLFLRLSPQTKRQRGHLELLPFRRSGLSGGLSEQIAKCH